MARPTTRTERLHLDDIARIRELFGTYRNAYELLNLEGRLHLDIFTRAMKFLPVDPEDANVINQAWYRWCREYLGRSIETIHTFKLEED